MPEPNVSVPAANIRSYADKEPIGEEALVNFFSNDCGFSAERATEFARVFVYTKKTVLKTLLHGLQGSKAKGDIYLQKLVPNATLMEVFQLIGALDLLFSIPISNISAVTERSLTPMEVKKAERIQQVINEWEDRVFLIKGEKLQGSGVLISNQRILTVAHLSFKLQQSYNIRGTKGRSFTVKCEFICKNNDFVMLISNDLPQMRISTTNLARGNKFLLMGYPSGMEDWKPTITKGTIEGIMNDNIHLAGTPGSKRGYSGGPVLDYYGYLAGILLGSTSGLTVDTTIRECLDSLAEQKYARILGTSIIISRYNQGHSDNES